MVKGISDVILEIFLAERSRRRLALKLPLFPIGHKDSSPVKRLEGITRECAANIIFAIMFLNVFEIDWMVDDVHAEEGKRDLISGSESMVKRIPGFATRTTIGLQLFDVACEGTAFRSRNPARISGARCPESLVAVAPT